MSERVGQENAPDQPQAPEEQAATADAPASAEQGNGEPLARRGPVPLKNPQSLERLRERVTAAARELERLRQENAALTARIQELETRPPVDFEGALLSFDDDPQTLRKKVEGFIETIDRYLAREAT